MGKLEPTDFYLYRWRYYIGYGLIIALLAVFLVFVGQNVPGALSPQEMQSVVNSSSIGIREQSTLAIPNAPYYVLQKFSLDAFGVTPLGVKFPSLVLAFVTILGAVFLLKRWFKPNVAILATLLIATTMEFLYFAQSGTPDIMYMLWAVWLLLAATQVTNKEGQYPKLWKAAFFILAGLSLYTPLSIYLLAAIISAALLHPHVRFVLKQLSVGMLFVYGILMLILILPLCYMLYLRPELMLELLGKPEVWPPDIMHNISVLFHRYFNFISPASGALITPVLDPVRLILVGLGAWLLARHHYNARSYTIAAWLILLTPILIINPAYSNITFVPFLILIASGIHFLLRSWYGIFPQNPYARVVGLIPIIVLVAGLVISSVDRYIYGYHYTPAVVSAFNRDSELLNKKLAVTKDPVAIVVANDELKFYQVVAKHAIEKNKTSIVVSTNSQQYLDKTETAIVSRKAKSAYSGQVPLEIITTSRASDGDRFYIYKNTTK
jgi:4-amino-4-deoxy-L-arabinose transferase-like glycosyltransferase